MGRGRGVKGGFVASVTSEVGLLGVVMWDEGGRELAIVQFVGDHGRDDDIEARDTLRSGRGGTGGASLARLNKPENDASDCRFLGT